MKLWICCLILFTAGLSHHLPLHFHSFWFYRSWRGFSGYELNWDIFLKQKNWENRYKKLPSFDLSEEYVVALKKNPLALEILDNFDKGKKRIVGNGKLTRITGKWFED